MERNWLVRTCCRDWFESLQAVAAVLQNCRFPWSSLRVSSIAVRCRSNVRAEPRRVLCLSRRLLQRHVGLRTLSHSSRSSYSMTAQAYLTSDLSASPARLPGILTKLGVDLTSRQRLA